MMVTRRYLSLSFCFHLSSFFCQSSHSSSFLLLIMFTLYSFIFFLRAARLRPWTTFDIHSFHISLHSLASRPKNYYGSHKKCISQTFSLFWLRHFSFPQHPGGVQRQQTLLSLVSRVVKSGLGPINQMWCSLCGCFGTA